MSNSINHHLIFALGVGIILAAGLMAVLVSNYSASQYVVWLTIMSLGVSIIIAFLPGTARLTVPGWVTATGAIAVFVLIFLRMFEFSVRILDQDYQKSVAEIDRLKRQLEETVAASTATESVVAALEDKLEDQRREIVSTAEQLAIRKVPGICIRTDGIPGQVVYHGYVARPSDNNPRIWTSHGYHYYLYFDNEMNKQKLDTRLTGGVHTDISRYKWAGEWSCQ